MSKRNIKQPRGPKTFNVSYYLNKAFVVAVRERSAASAECSVRQWLQDNDDEFPESECVEHDFGITGTDEVHP